ncbi:MAG TPA: hypothetical protein VHD87_06110 [Acidimicrobiales bacterium]|nr:hypothetical protein [Acidimicrobiales bacterium]
MGIPRSRRAFAASAAGFAAVGGLGIFALMNALGGASPGVNFAPAAATDNVPTTVTSIVDGVTNAAAGDTTTTAAADNSGGTTTTTTPSSTNPATGNRHGCDHDGDHQPLDAATSAKVQASAEKAVPDATFEHADHDRSNPSGYVAMMEKADGTHVLVHEDANFTVTKVEDPAPQRGPGGPGGHHRGDRGHDYDGDRGGTTPTTSSTT